MILGPRETRREYESYREDESLLLIIDENVVHIRGTHDTRVRVNCGCTVSTFRMIQGDHPCLTAAQVIVNFRQIT